MRIPHSAMKRKISTMKIVVFKNKSLEEPIKIFSTSNGVIFIDASINFSILIGYLK